MRYAFVVGLVLSMHFPALEATAQERGIVSFKSTVVKVRDASLELASTERIGDGRNPILFDVAADSRFEEVGLTFVDGKPKLVRKAIALKDLVPTQRIDVIAIVVGDRPTILVGVVNGAAAAGAEAMKLVAKLGGTVRDVSWKKDEKRYEIDLSDSNVTDDDLASIAPFDELVGLKLNGTKITDKGIAHLANHPTLLDLHLSGTKVTNGMLTHLATLRRIDNLFVDHTSVTRQALMRFAKSNRLRVFCLVSAGPKHEYRVHEQLRPYGDDDDAPHVFLMKRSVYYGRYYPDSLARRKPTTYYHRDGPVGTVLSRFDGFPRRAPHDDPSEVRLPASAVGLASFPVGGMPMGTLACLWSEPAIGVVELNAGTIAAYGRPFQTIDFFNDVPELVPFNRTVDGKRPPLGFIEDSMDRGCNVRIIDGTFKKAVRKDAPRGFYSAIFVDITVQQRTDARAIKKDDVHFDLMTQEAIRELMDKTTSDGVVCYHISHRTHEFYKPLAAAAAALGFACKRVNDKFDTYQKDVNAKVDGSHFMSEWVVIARRPEHLARLRNEVSKTRNLEWLVPLADETAAWRDGVEPVMPIRPQ